MSLAKSDAEAESHGVCARHNYVEDGVVSLPLSLACHMRFHGKDPYFAVLGVSAGFLLPW